MCKKEYIQELHDSTLRDCKLSLIRQAGVRLDRDVSENEINRTLNNIAKNGYIIMQSYEEDKTIIKLFKKSEFILGYAIEVTEDKINIGIIGG